MSAELVSSTPVVGSRHFGPGQGNETNGKNFSISPDTESSCHPPPKRYSWWCVPENDPGGATMPRQSCRVRLCRGPQELTWLFSSVKVSVGETWWKTELLSTKSPEVLALLAAVVPCEWYIAPKFTGLNSFKLTKNHLALSCSSTFFCVFLVKFGSTTKLWFSWIESCEVPVTQNSPWEDFLGTKA